MKLSRCNVLTWGAGALVAAGLLFASAGSVKADIIPSLATVTMHGSNFTFTYSVDLTNDETVKTNDFFTIYDFSGLVAGTNFQPANWVFSSALVGITPPNVTPPDNPHIPNMTWTYTGSPTIGPGPLNLGSFGADSTFSKTHLTSFASEAHKYAPGEPGNGKPVQNVGSTGGPISSVPEASSIVLLIPALAPLGFLLRKQRA